MTSTIDKCVAFLAANAQWFRPQPSAQAEVEFLSYKAFSELCLLGYLAHKRCHAVVPPAAVSMCRDILSSEPFIYRVLCDRRRILLYSSPILFGRALALPAGAIGAPLASAKSSLSVEKPPHRILDLHFYLTEMGFDSPYDVNAVLALSNLNEPPVPPRCTVEDVYALTHNAFYASKFGSFRLDIHPVLASRLSRALELLSIYYLQQGNIDLLIELVIAHEFLGLPGSTAWNVVQRRTVAACRDFEALKSAESDGSIAFAKSNTMSSDFSSRYHTILVFCLLALTCPTVIEDEIVTDQSAEESVDAIGHLLFALEADQLLDALSIGLILDREYRNDLTVQAAVRVLDEELSLRRNAFPQLVLAHTDSAEDKERLRAFRTAAGSAHLQLNRAIRAR